MATDPSHTTALICQSDVFFSRVEGMRESGSPESQQTLVTHVSKEDGEDGTQFGCCHKSVLRL